MVLSLLKPILNPILAPAVQAVAPASAPTAQPTAAPAVTAQGTSPLQGQTQNTPPSQTDGVKFDLSDKALQLVEDAAATQASAPPPQSPAAAVSPRAATEAAEPKATGASAADSAQALDPTEEERARAWAIRGMERERLLNLVETLKITPQAEPAQKEVAEHTAAQAYVQAAPASERKTAA